MWKAKYIILFILIAISSTAIWYVLDLRDKDNIVQDYVETRPTKHWVVELPAKMPSFDNYVAQVVTNDGDILTWAKMPVTVYIDNEKFREMQTKALLYLNESLQGYIEFAQAPNKAKADIIIETTEGENPDTDPEKAQISANTFYEYNKRTKELKKAVISIYTINSITGKEFSDTELYKITLHETIHALGIIGHSYYPTDIMFVGLNRYQKMRLTTRDIRTLQVLYGDKKFLKKQIALLKQNSEDELNATLSGEDNLSDPTELLTKAKAYYVSGDEKAALQVYQMALKLDPQNSESLFGIGNCYYDGGKYAEALKYYTMALGSSTSDKRSQDIEERRAKSYTMLRQYENAALIYKKLFFKYPEREDIFNNYLHVLTALKDKKAMVTTINFYLTKFPEKKMDDRINRIMLWALTDRVEIPKNLREPEKKPETTTVQTPISSDGMTTEHTTTTTLPTAGKKVETVDSMIDPPPKLELISPEEIMKKNKQ